MRRWIVLAAGTLAVFGVLGLARFGYSCRIGIGQAGNQPGDSAGVIDAAWIGR